MKKTVALFGLLALQTASAQAVLKPKTDPLSVAINPKVIEWRRHLHQNPELSNREFKTGEMVATHLKNLGFEVREKVAHTGVVGVLRGGKPGPVVALRADMDALPVAERVNLPFASKAKSVFNGQEVGVMHACGHDTHVAMLMGVAEVLAAVKKDLAGTVVFIFQPAEEGPPEGERGGAKMMVEEGVLDNPKVEAVFGLHINSQTEVNKVKYKSGGIMAAADVLKIKVSGKQTHGSQPWNGVDPVVVSAQIINGLQTVVSRQMDITQEAAVVTISMVHGGVRSNIIPETVEMEGTIRTLDENMRTEIHQRVERTAIKIAESMGAKAEVSIKNAAPLTYNDPTLMALMLPTLEQAAGKENVINMKAVTGAEDFSEYGKKVPSLFFFIGGMTAGKNPKEAPAHHTPDFYIDESGLGIGVKTLVHLTLDYFDKKGTPAPAVKPKSKSK